MEKATRKSAQDNRFGKAIYDKTVKVDLFYDYKLCLRRLIEGEEDTAPPIYNFEDAVYSPTFHSAIDKKIFSGGTYRFRLFEMMANPSPRKFTSINCLRFLKNQNAMLVGTQGLVLFLSTVGLSVLEDNKFIISFDESANLPMKAKSGNDETVRLLPVVGRINSEFYFLGKNFSTDWREDRDSYQTLILCVNKI